MNVKFIDVYEEEDDSGNNSPSVQIIYNTASDLEETLRSLNNNDAYQQLMGSMVEYGMITIH